MPREGLGSMTKEFPLSTLNRAIEMVTPGMSRDQFREAVGREINRSVPAIVANRFLLVDPQDRISYDHFLSLVNSEGITIPRIRKIMYFIWAFREERLRHFILERIVDANGKWRPVQVTRKANADFFERYFEPRTAPKVRSNIERFFVETGVFNERNRTVHLELDDGWLVDAIQVVAQHESNAAQRRAMVMAPVEFLIANRLNGLANVTIEELRGHAGTVAAEPDPLEDEEIGGESPSISTSRAWNRAMPSSTDRQSAAAVIDLVARERASRAHWQLEKILSDSARARGYNPQDNNQIDMHFETPTAVVLAEMKSCYRRNLRSQVRRGISQLFEYRFLYREVLGENIIPILVLETRPTGRQSWLIDYLGSLGILLAWEDSGRILATAAIPAGLEGVVFPTA
jgi:hypothetical protein